MTSAQANVVGCGQPDDGHRYELIDGALIDPAPYEKRQTCGGAYVESKRPKCRDGRRGAIPRYRGTMAFNIKNEVTQQLARSLAAATGETVTGAITVALRERLERVTTGAAAQRDRKADRLRVLAADAAGRWKPELREVDHADVLYDERGLPR